jgi:predicted DNA-binding transcriptional regulator AlpA
MTTQALQATDQGNPADGYIVVPKLLDEHQLSEITGQSVYKIRKDRMQGCGPAFVKLGSNVRYRPSDVADYIASNLRQNTSEEAK